MARRGGTYVRWALGRTLIVCMPIVSVDPSQTDDRELLRQFVSTKSAQAFEQLVRRNANMVYSAARRQLGDSHLAEDVTQAVFLLLAEKAASIKGPLAGWLLAVTFNACRNARRIAARRAFHETRAAAMKLHDPQPQPEITWDDYAPLIDAAMSKLGRGDRDAIALRYFRECSLREVGAFLGISDEAARKRVDRAVEKLRTILGAQSAVPALGIFASQLAGKASLQAPANLVQSVVSSLAGSAKGTLANVIATKTARAMISAKVTLITTIIFVTAVVGIGAATFTKLIREMQSPQSSSVAPPAPAQPAQPPAAGIAEASVPGTMQLAFWRVFVDDRTAAQLRQITQPVQTTSVFYQAYRGSGAEIRKLFADSIGTGGLLQASNNLFFAIDGAEVMGVKPGELAIELGRDHMIGMPDNGPAMKFSLRSDDAQEQYLIANPDRLHVTINDANFKVNFLELAGGRLSTLREQPPKIDIQFQGDLPAGDALVMTARYVLDSGRAYNHVIVWETFHAAEKEKHFIRYESSTQWWCIYGPDKLRHWADAARVWSADADPKSAWFHYSPYAVQRKFSDGKSIYLFMLSHQSNWPGCWWTPNGKPARAMRVSQWDGDPPHGLLFALVVPGGDNQWERQHHDPNSANKPKAPDDNFYPSFDSEPDGTTQLKVGEPVGPWEDAAHLMLNRPISVDGVKFEARAVRRWYPQVIVDFNEEGVLDNEYVLVATDRAGSERYDPNQPFLDSEKYANEESSEQKEPRYKFSPLKVSDLAYFKLMRRKREFVTFDGFATQPAVAPREDVTSDDADAAEAEAARRVPTTQK
jgi:RNA polymerase sigma factor (sigma-70 family)